MTGGYTILDLGGNVFTVEANYDAAIGKKVEGIYDRIEGNNPNKPFLLENYSLSEGIKENARFVDFSGVGGPFEAFEARINVGVTVCRVIVENNDTVKFVKFE